MAIDIGKSIQNLNHLIFYKDRLTCFRRSYTATDDAYLKDSELSTVFADIPCYLSMSGRRSLNSGGRMDKVKSLFGDREVVDVVSTLFADSSLDIKAGDVLLISREGKTFFYEAGEPRIFMGFQELLVRRIADA